MTRSSMSGKRGEARGVDNEGDFLCEDVAGQAKETIVRCGLLGDSVVNALKGARVTYKESNNPYLDVVLPGDLACMYVPARQLESFDRMMQQELQLPVWFSHQGKGKENMGKGTATSNPGFERSLKGRVDEIRRSAVFSYCLWSYCEQRHKSAAICIEKSKSVDSSSTISKAQYLFVVKHDIQVIPVCHAPVCPLLPCYLHVTLPIRWLTQTGLSHTC